MTRYVYGDDTRHDDVVCVSLMSSSWLCIVGVAVDCLVGVCRRRLRRRHVCRQRSVYDVDVFLIAMCVFNDRVYVVGVVFAYRRCLSTPSC
jgi:hypothetical protein